MRKSKVKFIITIIVLIVMLGTATGLIGYYSNWFTNWDKFNPGNWFEKDDKVEEGKDKASGSILNLLTNNGFSFVSNKIPASEFSTAGVVKEADSAFSLNAIIQPSIAENKNVSWSARWNNVSSDWSRDKDIADYLTFNKSITQSGETVVLTFLQDFGEQILITASAEADSSIKAICSADYQKRIKSINYAFKYDNNAIDNVTAEADGVYRFAYTGELKSYTIEPIPVYSAYTIDVSYSSVITGTFTDTFGFGSDIVLTNLSIDAGLNYVVESEMSEQASNFVNNANKLKTQNSFTPYFSYMINLLEEYDNLTATDKNHSVVKNVYDAICQAKTAIDYPNHIGQDKVLPFMNKFNEILATYTKPLPYYVFMNVIEKINVNIFLQKALDCNNANKGVVDYYIKYSNGDFVYDYKISLGFTSSSLQAVTDVEIDNGEIIV